MPLRGVAQSGWPITLGNGDGHWRMREEGGERLLCLFNFGREQKSWKRPARIGDLKALDMPGYAAMSDGRQIALAPLGAAVLRIG